jgi:hypothetical protein
MRLLGGFVPERKKRQPARLLRARDKAHSPKEPVQTRHQKGRPTFQGAGPFDIQSKVLPCTAPPDR